MEETDSFPNLEVIFASEKEVLERTKNLEEQMKEVARFHGFNENLISHRGKRLIFDPL